MYPSGSFTNQAGGPNTWSDWPTISHQEATYPSQASGPPVFSESEDTFVADSQSYCPLPAAPQPTEPSLMAPPDHPKYAQCLCVFAQTYPTMMARVHAGEAGDDDFATMGRALCGLAPNSTSPSGQKAFISLAKLVYRHVQGTFVRWYNLWRPVTSRFTQSTIDEYVPQLQAAARQRETPTEMPWKELVVDTLGHFPRFWGYVDYPEGLAWTEDCIVSDDGAEPSEGIGGGHGIERFAAASQDVKLPVDAGSSSSPDHPFSQNGSGITYPALHDAMHQMDQDFPPQHTTSANASAALPAPSSQQHVVNSQTPQAAYAGRPSIPNQSALGSSPPITAPTAPSHVPVLHRHQSLPSNPSALAAPHLSPDVRAAAPSTSGMRIRRDPSSHVIALTQESRLLFEAGLISKETYGETLLIGFKHMAEINGYRDARLTTLALLSPSSSSPSSGTSALRDPNLMTQSSDGHSGEGVVPSGAPHGGYRESGGQPPENVFRL